MPTKARRRAISASADSGDDFQLGEEQSIHSMTTDAWQQTYEADGYVDLWVQEEFNSGSRLVVRSPSHLPLALACMLALSARHTGHVLP